MRRALQPCGAQHLKPVSDGWTDGRDTTVGLRLGITAFLTVAPTMQSQDTYRLKLQQTAASLKAWSGFVADVARVEMQEEGDAWRLALTPMASRACPVEMVLDGAAPKFDLRLGTETYEDLDLPSLDLVLPMVEAVTEGRVVTRRTASAITGLPLAVSTHLKLADGTALDFPATDQSANGRNGAVESRVVHYLPYRRPNERD